VFLANRAKLVHFLRARGAGEEAEDLAHEVWLKIAAASPGPVGSPLAYLFRTADLLLIDRYRSARQARRREHEWSEINVGDGDGASDAPSAERLAAGRQDAGAVMRLLDSLGERPAVIFRRHRIDGIAQKQLAAELGVSLSTVESDLRLAYRALVEWKERNDAM